MAIDGGIEAVRSERVRERESPDYEPIGTVDSARGHPIYRTVDDGVALRPTADSEAHIGEADKVCV
jgi:hypothetical protein